MLLLIAIFIIIIFLLTILGWSPEPNIKIERENAIPKNAVKITSETDIFPPILHSSEWMEPIPLQNSINTARGEGSTFITKDGNTLYFFFTPDVNILAENQLLDGVTGIYVSINQNGSWRKAKRVMLQHQGKLALDGCVFI